MIEKDRIPEQFHTAVSVRNLVEFILRSGDITQGSGTLKDADAMLAGSNLHRKLQKEAGSNYSAEVYLKLPVLIDESLEITVEGRADGIITELENVTENGEMQVRKRVTVDEIKGTYQDVNVLEEPVEVHKAQAKCYAYIYSKIEGLDFIDVQMTYAHLESGRLKRFKNRYGFTALETWFTELLNSFAKWVKWQIAWNEKRNRSIRDMQFPFNYRASQKKLVSGVYRTIIQGKRLFIEAPTGTGKTISTVYPAVKAMGEGKGSKIFYLTAKTIARTVAEDTYGILKKQGVDLKTITLTAKEKLCILDEPACDPRTCERALGHFDRINDALFEMINEESTFGREQILFYAEKYHLCPFEMQLDIALWMDSIICDYNYVFDPNVYLKRFFNGGKGDYLFLIDEAHNLVDRAREMYSAVLYRSDFVKIKRLVKPLRPKLAVKVEKCNKFLLELMGECENCQIWESPGSFTVYLMRVVSEMELLLKEEIVQETRKELVEFYLNMRNFLNAYDLMDECYISYMEQIPGDFMVKIFCVDPAKNISERLAYGKSAIFFSATLLPIHYYKEMLSATCLEDYDLYVDSPFSPSNRLLFIGTDVSSKFTRRNESEFIRVCEYIRKIIRGRNGNYFVFFPSYAYMQSVFEVFTDRELQKAGHGIEIVMQETAMTEAAKQDFLDKFKEKPNTTILGFCVLGGVFSEGIDLKDDRLIGAVIVGTGLPQISHERELLKAYFDRRQGSGFDYAYLFAGMNKVLQAGGRVIRTEKDRGIIALLDERFSYSQYRNLFPREWASPDKANIHNIEEKINQFWEQG